MKTSRMFLVVAVLTLVASACGKSGSSNGPSSSPSPAGGKTFTSQDAQNVVPAQSDAPNGTEFVADQSGEQTLAQFADTTDEKTELQNDGFQTVFVTLFLSSDLQQENAQPGADSHVMNAFAMIFNSADGAHSAYNWYVNTFLPAQTKEPQQLENPSLGDESYGVSFKEFQQEPLPGSGYIWRHGNMLLTTLSATGSGFGTTNEALQAAQEMDAKVS